MLRRLTFIAYVAAATAAFIVASMTLMAPPAAAQQPATVNRLDEQWFAYWNSRRSAAAEAIDAQVADDETVVILNDDSERDRILPPVSDWNGDIRVCDAANNPPEGWTRFGGFCDQIKYPDRQSLLFQGTDAIFGFKG